MGIIGKADRVELEKMLSRVCTVALWELAVTNGITDEQAWGAVVELMAWLAPIDAHFASLESKEE